MANLMALTSTYDSELFRYARTFLIGVPEISARMKEPCAPLESFRTSIVAAHVPFDPKLPQCECKLKFNSNIENLIKILILHFVYRCSSTFQTLSG